MHKGDKQLLTFTVIPDRARQGSVYKPALGLKACEKLGLIKLVWNVEIVAELKYESIMEEFAYNFKGLDCLPGLLKVHVDPTAPSVQHACRKIPFKIRDKVKAELQRMEKLGVIQRQEEPTYWVGSLTYTTKKNGDIRICLDPRSLNKAIKREHCKMRSREEIMAEFAEAKFFSKLDASTGFWQIKLDPESSKLTCFNSPFGRYVYRRLPFGLNMAPEAYHMKIHQLFESVEGVNTMMDDIIVWGSTRKEHDACLRKVFEIMPRNNLKLNKSKCEFGVRKLIFMGDLTTDKGIMSDPSKISAITNMPRPQNKTELQRFIGMTNYSATFVPELSSQNCPFERPTRPEE